MLAYKEADASPMYGASTGLDNIIEMKSGLDESKSIDIKRVKKSIKGLKSGFKIKRIESAVYLGAVGSDEARSALEDALKNEKEKPVCLYIANSLADIGDEKSLPILIESLISAQRWYREKVNMLITGFGGKLMPLLPELTARREMEIKELLVDFASVYVAGELKDCLFNLIDSMNTAEPKANLSQECETQGKFCCNCKWGRNTAGEGERICKYKGVVSDRFYCNKYTVLFASINIAENYEKLVYKAAEIASKLYYDDLAAEKYVFSANETIRKIAVGSLSNIITKENYIRLNSLLSDEAVSSNAVSSMIKLIIKDNSFIPMTTDFFLKEKDQGRKENLAEILSYKMSYFMLRLKSPERKYASEIIKQTLLLGKTSAVIGFLNSNKDLEIENLLLAIIKTAIEENASLNKEFCTYLNERLLGKLDFLKCDTVLKVKEREKNPELVRALYSLLILMLVIFPVIYVIRHYGNLTSWPFLLQAKTYVVDFNYYLIFFSAAINIIYLLLLLFSRINVSGQARLWNAKSHKMLFKDRMLPGVSIIAPAYNEEKVIIESANSLLNLTYPDYELIIVNDGSRDRTLSTLIDYFGLKRVDFSCDKRLNTALIRGVFKNPSFPKLIVVDKENAGKADSLNAGIIISGKEYFCCIDADSLLENDALLKLASQTLDEGTETPALGGNVYPINGCKVERGYISKIKIPKNAVARFQNIEYIRAFMAGRLGWAYINSLLIISGAFGLFKKERVIDVGGYLTSNEKYKKDTVGEDMELVVRISRRMRELKHRYRINYCYNANCWTEVPENLLNLKKQRYRWHRGLIEIMHFHKSVIFNPRYGSMGMLSMPYFFIFEMAGPLIEIQGYIMVVAAFLLAILNWQIALLLFVSNILLGVLVSISSLIIAEKENVYYSYGDIMRLVMYAVIENFGPRQLFNFWRVIGYFQMFAKPKGWGYQTRKGFGSSEHKEGG